MFSPVFGLPIHFLNYVFWWGLIFNFNEDYPFSFPFFYIYSYLWYDKTIHDYTYVMNILFSVTVEKQNYWFFKKLTHLLWRNKPWMKLGVKVWVIQSCPTLCDPIDYSPPGSSVSGIFQARILEWVAISSSRESSWPRDWTWFPEALEMARRFFTTEPSGKPSYPEKTIIQKVPCIPVFTEALFTIARTWK